MSIDDLKKMFGEDYPAAIVDDGIRLPLSRETKFTRVYCSPAHPKREHHISRFMDGSASMTLSELKAQWPHWTPRERGEFCSDSSWLHEQADYCEMLRFIVQHAGPNEWSAVALAVGCYLPQAEAFDMLLVALSAAKIGNSSNIAQAIAKTKHPAAEATLRNHLCQIWAHPALWDDDPFVNWVAFDATTCIAHLVDLGARRPDFEEQALQLSRHKCPGNRDSVRNFLTRYYPCIQ